MDKLQYTSLSWAWSTTGSASALSANSLAPEQWSCGEGTGGWPVCAPTGASLFLVEKALLVQEWLPYRSY